jgi:hypothetical protein
MKVLRACGQRRKSKFVSSLTAIVILCLVVSGSSSAQTKSSTDVSAAQQRELQKYPLNDFGEVFTRLQKEVRFPEPRSSSRLLPLLPKSTVFYAAFPNYGDAAQQALKIFRQEREGRPALGDWWQKGDMAKTGPEFESAIEQMAFVSQYLGDEIVIAGSMPESGASRTKVAESNNSTPSVVLISEVRKPGLKQVLEIGLQKLSGPAKPEVRVLDRETLAIATDGASSGLCVLVRPDYVIAASDLATLRNFNRDLDAHASTFTSSPFGQRLQESYKGGLSIMAGLDLQKLLHEGPIQQSQSQMLKQTGFDDVQYAIWEHKGLPGLASSEAELSFAHPRHGVAGWLAPPRDLASLDFVSPQAILAATIALKNFGQVFDDVQTLAMAANPKAVGQFELMEGGMGVNLKDDLFSLLGGEVTVELDDVVEKQPAWKIILQVNDPAHLQKTFDKLLATAQAPDRKSEEGGITYHILNVPSGPKPMEVGYAFVDGYLVIGSSGKAVREAVRLRREGGGLAKSSTFQAALPPGHSAQASAMLYEDPTRMVGMQMSRFAPQFAQAFSGGSSSGATSSRALMKSSPAVIAVYGDESAIREASASQGVDVGMVMVMAAVAIPNFLRAKIAADDSAAVGALRTLVTAQVAYSATYPARGYARDLARLGPFPGQPDVVTANHAGLVDGAFAKPTCTTGTWCEKSGYKFTFGDACPKLLCQEFVAVATPASSSSGGRNLCAVSDGVIRYRVGPPLFAPISARECRTWTPLQ